MERLLLRSALLPLRCYVRHVWRPVFLVGQSSLETYEVCERCGAKRGVAREDGHLLRLDYFKLERRGEEEDRG